jgi:hypothetical protein
MPLPIGDVIIETIPATGREPIWDIEDPTFARQICSQMVVKLSDLRVLNL